MGDRLNTDLTLFMPQGATAEERLLLDELREGPAGRLILLAVEGGSSSARARISRQLASQLQSIGLFTRVSNGGQQLNADEWRRLIEYRYLLSPGVSAKSFTVNALRTALGERLQELASPLSALYARLLPADPTAELQVLERALRPSRQPAMSGGVWSSSSGNQVLLLAETRASGFDINAQQQAVESIHAAFDTIDPNGDFRLLLSGPGVYGVMSREVIRSESTLLSLIASGLVAVILFIGYRSLPLILLSALPVMTALVAGATVVTLWFGSIHGITLAFGITLLGMTIDYPIHLFSHIRPDEDPKAGLRRIWSTLRLSAFTSGAAFAVIMTAGFGGLAQLGLFMVTGLTAAALFTRWLMPEMLGRHVLRSGPDISVRWVPLTHAWGGGCGAPAASPLALMHRARTPILVLIGIVLLLSLLWLWFQRAQLWEDDLAALSPIPLYLINQDRALRHQLNAPEVSHLLVVTADSAEQALRQAEEVQSRLQLLQSEEVIRGSDLLTRLLPSARTQLKRRDQLPETASLRRNLEIAMEGMPYRPGTFEPFLESVEKSRASPPLTPEKTTGTLFGNKVESLLHRAGAGWILIVPLSGVNDPRVLEQTFNDQLQGNVRYINLKNETNRFVTRFRDEALYRLGWGLLIMIAVLLIALKSPSRVAWVLLPVIIALVIDIALLLALGQRLSLFHLVSLLLVVGISLDYSLFINRSEVDWQERRRTLHSLTVCFASTAAVFGLLALSELPVLKAIGSTVVIGVTSGYIVSLALSPKGVKSA
jgi:predicted exporter